MEEIQGKVTISLERYEEIKNELKLLDKLRNDNFVTHYDGYNTIRYPKRDETIINLVDRIKDLEDNKYIIERISSIFNYPYLLLPKSSRLKDIKKILDIKK